MPSPKVSLNFRSGDLSGIWLRVLSLKISEMNFVNGANLNVSFSLIFLILTVSWSALMI